MDGPEYLAWIGEDAETEHTALMGATTFRLTSDYAAKMRDDPGLAAGVVDRFPVVVFPVIAGATGKDRIFDGHPDIALDLVYGRTFDGRLQLLEYVPHRARWAARRRRLNDRPCERTASGTLLVTGRRRRRRRVDRRWEAQVAAVAGSARTTTVSRTSVTSSAGMPARSACSRTFSALVPS